MEFSEKQKVLVIGAFIALILLVLFIFWSPENLTGGVTQQGVPGSSNTYVGSNYLVGGPSAGNIDLSGGIGTNFSCNDVNGCIFSTVWSSLDNNLQYYYLRTTTSPLTLPSIVGENGKFLTNDGAGSLSWASVSFFDSNWQTSWFTFDANMAATYAALNHAHDLIYLRINDLNSNLSNQTCPTGYALQTLGYSVSCVAIVGVDTNTQSAGWTNASGAWLVDVNVNKNNVVDLNSLRFSNGVMFVDVNGDWFFCDNNSGC